MKPFFIPSCLALLLMLVPAARAADVPAAAAPVVTLDNTLLDVMKAAKGGAAFKARYATLAPVVQQSYDLPTVTQNSVGFLWSTLPAAQQQELITLFTVFTVDNYVAQFDDYGGETFKLLPDERELGTKKIVQTQLVPGDGSAPTELDYVMANGKNGWQINDVLLNGTISQVAVHASDFASLVQPGDASKLIAALKKKNAKLESE